MDALEITEMVQHFQILLQGLTMGVLIKTFIKDKSSFKIIGIFFASYIVFKWSTLFKL